VRPVFSLYHELRDLSPLQGSCQPSHRSRKGRSHHATAPPLRCSMDRRVCHPCKGHANPRAIHHAGPLPRTVHVPHSRGIVTVASAMPARTVGPSRGTLAPCDRRPVNPCTMNPTGCHRCKDHANVRDGANLYTKRARALQGSCQRFDHI
jgi:hypothetical protein